MAAQRGRDMLVYIGPASGIGPSTLIAGMTETGITMNNDLVDISTKDTNGWRELLEDGSMKSFSISCSGIFKDTASDETIRANAFANSIDTYTFKYGNGDTVECDFQITGYNRTGPRDGAETYSLTFESTGEPVFTAA